MYQVKNTYETPIVELIVLESDVVRTSGNNGTDIDGEIWN